MIAFDAVPLEGYSSLHKLPIFKLLGLNTRITPKISLSFNFNLQLSLQQKPKSLLQMNLRDAQFTRPATVDFSIENIKRWRMAIGEFKTMQDYVASLKSNYKKNYLNTQKAFAAYGATMTFIDGDWSAHVETVYQLYLNVANRRGAQLYDLNFFRYIAKTKGYQLLCVWYEGVMISMLIVFDEAPVYHSMLVGFDYEHSKHIYAYSLIHYDLIRRAIESGKHQYIDVGITANKAKSMMGFKPVTVSMDVSAKNPIIKYLLRFAGCFIRAKINEDSKLVLKLNLLKRQSNS